MAQSPALVLDSVLPVVVEEETLLRNLVAFRWVAYLQEVGKAFRRVLGMEERHYSSVSQHWVEGMVVEKACHGRRLKIVMLAKSNTHCR